MKKVIFGLLVLGIGIAGFLLTNNPTQGQRAPQQDPDDEPTVVKSGPRTKNEKEYSKRIKNQYAPGMRKLSEFIKFAKEKGHNGQLERSVLGEFPVMGPSPTPTKFLQNLACKSDAIVLGTPKTKVAHLTEDEAWVYTEFDFLVKDVLKNNSDSPIAAANNIKVARSGGRVKLDGHVFRVRNRLLEQLKKNKEYLLFLTYVPETNGYVANSYKGDFVLNGKRFKELSKLSSPGIKDLLDVQTLLNSVRDAVASGCGNNSGGK